MLVQIIEESLETLFGKRTTAMIFDFLKAKFMLQKNEIPMNAKILSEVLHTFFGSASGQIELRILRKLCEKSGTEFKPEENASLVDYIAAHRALVKT